ncbi:MAG: DUF72 domain-containing protein [Betaproteobacteria bacterium]|nr:DUF72 domain-containing protein [Betaproteobacteria bacterium]MDH3436883.1 DUF72 domain-containing protein [Betaproteobacteria bacterium]
MARRRARILIGTSGWSYPHWRGPFYPVDLPHEVQLAFYAERFRSVEINSTFYRLPERKTLKAWHDAVPGEFVFAVKASRFITHMKKLNTPAPALRSFFRRIEVLGDKLGPVLFQLPPRWRCNPKRLASFLGSLSRDFRYAFEFRDPSWLTPDIYGLLAHHNAALCIYELAGYRSPIAVTSRLVYIRLHGSEGPYQGCYDRRTLAHWAKKIRAWSSEGRSVCCYFDNDQLGYAALNARELACLVGRQKAPSKTW